MGSSQAHIKEGKKYGKLTAVKFVRKVRHNYWMFRCDCGVEKEIRTDGVYSGAVVSCGCHKNNNLQEVTHGKSKTRIYRIWTGMKQRCSNRHNAGYKNYGERGIKVCKRWMKFENFYEDMGEAPRGKSLDRIDNDGDYRPNNCRWATQKQQHRNKRTNVVLLFRGKKVCIADLADMFNIKYDCMHTRIRRLNWDIEKAVSNNNSKN